MRNTATIWLASLKVELLDCVSDPGSYDLEFDQCTEHQQPCRKKRLAGLSSYDITSRKAGMHLITGLGPGARTGARSRMILEPLKDSRA